MKAIIAGCRYYTDANFIAIKLNKFKPYIDEVLSGGAQGVDQLGERWAEYYSIPVRKYPADWAKHGRAAGPIRNEEMAKDADALFAFWDGNKVRSGTWDMIQTAIKYKLQIHIFFINKNESDAKRVS